MHDLFCWLLSKNLDTELSNIESLYSASDPFSNLWNAIIVYLLMKFMILVYIYCMISNA